MDELRAGVYVITDSCYIKRILEKGRHNPLIWVKQSFEDKNARKEIGDEVPELNSELRAFYNKNTQILTYLDSEWYDDDDPDFFLDCDCISEGSKHPYSASRRVLKEIPCRSYSLKKEDGDIPGKSKKRFLEVVTVSGEIKKIYL